MSFYKMYFSYGWNKLLFVKEMTLYGLMKGDWWWPLMMLLCDPKMLMTMTIMVLDNDEYVVHDLMLHACVRDTHDSTRMCDHTLVGNDVVLKCPARWSYFVMIWYENVVAADEIIDVAGVFLTTGVLSHAAVVFLCQDVICDEMLWKWCRIWWNRWWWWSK